MTVDLIYNTPLWVADKAISKCWDKECDSSTPNLERIDRVANKNKHESTIEHLVYTFEIKGISRALLQELARHRLASYSVKSTRYTLKELKDGSRECKDFYVSTGSIMLDESIERQLQDVYIALVQGISNDKVKYMLPEAYKTELVMTINARSLRNLLKLRTGKSALKEFQELANEIYNTIPSTHQFLFCDYLNRESEEDSKKD